VDPALEEAGVIGMPKQDVLVVAKVHPMYLEALETQYNVHICAHEGDTTAFAALAPRIVGVAAGGESSVPGSLLARLPNLKVVSVFGVGYDGVDVPAALRLGVSVTHTPGVLTDDVADLALGLVGLGRIGQAIARRAAAFDMAMSYTARSPKTGCTYTYYYDAAALAAQVDFLVVITPGGAGTRHLINADVLRALGPKGYLINVARGSVVDEQALIAALASGQIAGAALDVFENEPQVPEALWSMPNVVLTPHMASATHQTRQAMADLAFANMHAGTAGLPLITPVPECTSSAAASHPQPQKEIV
jgi:lactate dehydrogenase-like 2-hydroxyacid dehydrogenase